MLPIAITNQVRSHAMRSKVIVSFAAPLLAAALIGCGGGSTLTNTGGNGASTTPTSKWVYYDTNGHLAYKQFGSNGDRIMDFSSAGYGGGEVSLPTATVTRTVSPSGGDDTANIQSAIDAVSALALNSAGLRGAVLLQAGSYTVSTTLHISASGVVLRGSGSTATVIHMQPAATPYPLISIAGSGSPVATTVPTAITDTYVPSGTTTLHVANAAGLVAGTDIIIHRPVTASWVHFMGMDQLYEGGVQDTWIAVGSDSLTTQRTIKAISGNTITLDAPMSDSIDSTYENPPGATLNAYSFYGRITNVGVESLRAIAPAVYGVPDIPSYQLVIATNAMNVWINDLSAQDTLASIVIDTNCKQVTVSNIAITHTVTQSGSARFNEYYVNSSTQVLFDHVSSTANHMTFFGTSSATQGPTVLRNGSFIGDGNVEPHQRWSTGLLVENTTVTGGGLHLIDRGTDGSGHGWTIGWGVLWNSKADELIVQQPPGAQNWMIGCKGTKVTQAAPGSSTVLPEGASEEHGTPVTPSSLYDAQLQDRLSH